MGIVQNNMINSRFRGGSRNNPNIHAIRRMQEKCQENSRNSGQCKNEVNLYL